MQQGNAPNNCTLDCAVSFEDDAERGNDKLSPNLSPRKNIVKPPVLDQRNINQSVYNCDQEYFVDKLELLLKYVSHPGKSEEIEKMLNNFGNLQASEIDLAARRKNMLLMAKNLRHRETEFLNAIDMLNLKEFQRMLDEQAAQEQMRLELENSNVKPKKGARKLRNHESTRSINNLDSRRQSVRNLGNQAGWNSSQRLIALGSFKEDQFKSDIYSDLQSTSKVNFGERQKSRTENNYKQPKMRSMSQSHVKRTAQFGLSSKNVTYQDHKIKQPEESISYISTKNNQSKIEKAKPKKSTVTVTRREPKKQTVNSRAAGKRKTSTAKIRDASCSSRLKSMISDANVGYMKDHGGLSYWENDNYMSHKRQEISDRDLQNEESALNDPNVERLA